MDLKEMNIVEKVFNAGIVGAGGAGFPAHIKLKTKVEYFIVNGAECEPFLATDKYLMRNHMTQVIRAMDIVGKHLEAKHLVIALKEKYHDEIEIIKKTIKEEASQVEIFLLGNYYPSGDEQMLVHDVTGRTVTPGGIPLSQDTVVANVGTMLHTYEAFFDQATTYKHVTVIGHVERPSIVKVPLGTKFSQCIELAGGTSLENYSAIIGGPMMGKVIDQKEIEEGVVTKTDGGIIILPSDHYLVRVSQTSLAHMKNQTQSACIQCRYCTDLCPRYLIGQPLEPHKIMRQFGKTNQYDERFASALLCCECGVCELFACPMQLAPRQVNAFLKGELAKQGIRYEHDGKEATTRPTRHYRTVSPERLISRIDMAGYSAKKPEHYLEFEPDKVFIPVSQHIGKPATPIVKVGDRVQVGDPIATVTMDDLGANIHASISGRVLAVGQRIVIEKTSKEGK